MAVSRALGILTLVCLALAPVARAEEPPLQAVLVPVFAWDPVGGVNGSSWITDLWVSNSGSTTANVDGLFWDCMLPGCGLVPAPLEPGVTVHASGLRGAGDLEGALLYLEETTAGSVGFGLRFRDLSRQATTWGTEIPAVRGNAFRDSRFSLVDVPVSADFRQTLRIYELDGTPRDAQVRIRVFRLDPLHLQPYDDPDDFLGEAVIPLRFVPAAGTRPEHPGYAQVSDLSDLAPLGDAERLRLEIEPVTPGLKLWAFVTIVHNETQHATVVTPQ